MKPNVVLLLSRNDINKNDAGSQRDLVFANFYLKMGFRVVYVGQSDLLGRNLSNDINSFTIFKSINPSIIEKMIFEIHYGKRVEEVMQSLLIEYRDLFAIHIVDIPIVYILLLKKICKKFGIKLIHDSVEWYSPINFKYSVLSYGYITKWLLNNVVIDSQFSVIAISRYLASHFEKKGCLTLRIPAVLPIDYGYVGLDYSLPIRLLYAGSPERKDDLKSIVLAFNYIPSELITLDIVGITKDRFMSLYGFDQSDIDSRITFSGRLSKKEVASKLMNSHYTVLLRPAKYRYAVAGFPTKVAESLAHSIPTITNITSDLGLYLFDRKNSIIVSTNDPKDFARALRSVVDISEEEYTNIRKGAYSTGKNYFLSDQYFDAFIGFLQLRKATI